MAICCFRSRATPDSISTCKSDSTAGITLNAVEQPLNNILDRIAAQAALRYRLNGNNLLIEADEPYWFNYRVDYVNVRRASESEVGVATQISTAGGTVGEDQNAQAGGEQGNLSRTTVRNRSDNDFWATLQTGLTSIVGGDEGAVGTPEARNPIIVNPMAGVVTVLATQRGHAEVQSYIDAVVANSARQVLIEMTIVEVSAQRPVSGRSRLAETR